MPTRKEVASSFFKMLFEQKVFEAYEKYISSDFIHHNQWFPGDRNSLMNAMAQAHKDNPHSKISFKHILEDGDFVVIHSHVEHNVDLAFSAIHILKFNNDKIIEMWDSATQIDKNSANKNGLF